MNQFQNSEFDRDRIDNVVELVHTLDDVPVKNQSNHIHNSEGECRVWYRVNVEYKSEPWQKVKQQCLKLLYFQKTVFRSLTHFNSRASSLRSRTQVNSIRSTTQSPRSIYRPITSKVSATFKISKFWSGPETLRELDNTRLSISISTNNQYYPFPISQTDQTTSNLKIFDL